MKSRVPACVAVLGFLGCAVACSQKSDENCTRAQAVIRQALAAKNFAGITQWRDYAYKQCADKSVLSQLDQEIISRQAKDEAEKHAAQQAEQQKQQTLNLFQQWVASARNAPDHSV